jgi:predicted amidohydrolase
VKSFNAGIIGQVEKIEKNIQLGVFNEGDISTITGREPEKFICDAKEYAADNNIFLVPGLYIKDGFLCSCLIDNTGSIIGEQKGTHLNIDWFSDLKRATEINIIETPFGLIFLCVDVDIYKPEVIRIAALSGAEIIICSQFINSKDYSEEMILAGPWQEAQQNCLYILDSTNHGGNIIGPCNVTNDLTGYLARGGFKDNIYSTLDSEKRIAAYESFPVFKSLNKNLYNRHNNMLCK